MNDKGINLEKGANLMDELLSDPFGDNQVLPSLQAQEKRAPRLIDRLPEENRTKAYQLAEQIDPKNHEAIISFGTPAQSKLLSFSHIMLEHVQKQDVGEVGEIISDLMKKLNEVNPDELSPERKSFFSRMFGKFSSSVQEVLSKYQKTGAQIDRISVKLERSKGVLISDINMLEKLYENNKEYFQALNVYIAAGEIKLDELYNQTIPELKKAAESADDQMKFQEVNDMLQFADRLDKRLYDLKLSREITIQSAPQIRLIQNTNQTLVEKIQSSIMTAIPLWKNQVAIALTLLRQQLHRCLKTSFKNDQ